MTASTGMKGKGIGIGVLVLVMLVSVGLAGTAHGASIIFADYSFWTNGSAGLSGADLELTPDLVGQEGTAFVRFPFDMTGNPSFSAYFQFRVAGNVNGADGFTFVIHNDPRGLLALGEGGGQLGYGAEGGGPLRIVNSLAVEFDNYRNPVDPNNNHVGIDTNGSVSSLVTAVPPFDINSGTSYYAWVDYDGTTNTLEVFVNTTDTKPASALITHTIDITSLVGEKAYIGFSGATGGMSNQHLIEDFSITGLERYTAAIPAMDQRGMVLFGLLLGLSALFVIRRLQTA